MKSEHSNSRIYGLDIMRAVAIAYVMFSHGYLYSGKIIALNYYRWFILDGVGLFFVLSGFLIGGILIRKIEAGNFSLMQLIDFWRRRWLRTLPAYFIILTLLLLLYYLRHQTLPPVWIKYYFFIQNFAGPHPLFFAEAWSLSVEEWFYLLVPFLFFVVSFLPIRKKWSILFCSFVILFMVTYSRIAKVQQYDYYSHGNFLDEIGKVFITRMDSIMYGVLASWFSIYYSKNFYRHKKFLLLGGLVLLVCCNIFFSPFFLTYLQLSVAPLGAMMLLPALSAIKSGNGFIYRVVTFISIISYSMYLTNHMIVQQSILPFVARFLHVDASVNSFNSFIVLILFWFITIFCSYVLYRFIERPFMDKRNKLKTAGFGML